MRWPLLLLVGCAGMEPDTVTVYGNPESLDAAGEFTKPGNTPGGADPGTLGFSDDSYTLGIMLSWEMGDRTRHEEIKAELRELIMATRARPMPPTPEPVAVNVNLPPPAPEPEGDSQLPIGGGILVAIGFVATAIKTLLTKE